MMPDIDLFDFMDNLDCEAFALPVNVQQKAQQQLEVVPESKAQAPEAPNEQMNSKQALKLEKLRARNRLAQQV
jgi:hypothetical protein